MHDRSSVRLAKTPPLSALPPNDEHAERAVIGAVLISPDLFALAGDLAPDDFYRRSHAAIWSAIQALAAKGSPLDAVTVANELRSIGRVGELDGGTVQITHILNSVPAATEQAFEAYARIVQTKASQRTILQRVQLAAAELREDQIEDLAAWRSALAGDIEREDRTTAATSAVSYDQGLKDLAVRFWTPRARLSTGLLGVDTLMGGLFGGDLVVVAARPGMGKTSFAMQVAERVAEQGKHVAVISCEMPSGELFGRMLSSRAGVPFARVRAGTMTPEERASLTDASQALRAAGRRIHVFDAAQPTIEAVRSIVGRFRRSVERSGGLGLVVVDYIQIMGLRDPSDRNGSVGHITAGLKAMAKTFDVPVLALSQLNRAVESRTNKRPTLADLRDSGSVEQDADVVAFLFRAGAYETPRKTSGPAELDVAKNRNGDTGVAHLEWCGPRTRFSDPDGTL